MEVNESILDIIGPWSEFKLQIIKNYAKAYAIILSKQDYLKFYYIDAFAGAGIHKSKDRDELIPGSPYNALKVEPKFNGYCFIDMDELKVNSLENISKDQRNVKVFSGDCNPILLEKSYPN
jgi:three-Cys-motif partner protein